MLVISRSLNTSIRINDQVTVKVLKLGQRRVTLGVDAPDDVSVRREEAVEVAEAKDAPTSDLRVLVVEDTPVHALIIERILSKAGVRNVVRISSGEEAIQLVTLGQSGKALKPDLILLDLHLPGVSGMQVLEAVKSSPLTRSIPVVVISGSESEKDVAQCLESGANAFIFKADNYDEFRRALTRTTDFWLHSKLAS